jgi:hypothetical protein
MPYPGGIPSSTETPPGMGPGGTIGGTFGTPGTTAPAQPVTQFQVQQAFQGADADRDGQLSRAEAARVSGMQRSFEDMDSNKDGLLSSTEFEAGMRP